MVRICVDQQIEFSANIPMTQCARISYVAFVYTCFICVRLQNEAIICTFFGESSPWMVGIKYIDCSPSDSMFKDPCRLSSCVCVFLFPSMVDHMHRSQHH